MPRRLTELLRRYPAAAYLGPFLIYCVFASLEPAPARPQSTIAGPAASSRSAARAASGAAASATASTSAAARFSAASTPTDSATPRSADSATPRSADSATPRSAPENVLSTDPRLDSASAVAGATWYPAFYSLKIAATIAALLLVWPIYRTHAVGGLALGIAVGLLGAPLWIGLCELRLEAHALGHLANWPAAKGVLEALGLSSLITGGGRPGFNPFAAWPAQPLLLGLFLAVRFLGLVAVVPLIEEFFYRGFLIRWFVRPDWTSVPDGAINLQAAVAATVVPMLVHPPGEWLAAAAWFSLVTWLYVRSRSVWSCVVAHGITNLLLGIYVLAFARWYLW